MSIHPRRAAYAALAAIGIVGGAASITAAATNPSPAPPAADASGPNGQATDTDDAGEVHEPSYTGSITVPEDESLSEADEAAALQPLARIDADQASAAATQAVPGKVLRVELDNENGSLVYSVEVDSGAGVVDVKVDAGNAKVLAQETDDDAGESDDDERAERSEGSEDADEAHETPDGTGEAGSQTGN